MPFMRHPVGAPGSITANLYGHLQSRAPTLLYDWREQRRLDFAEGDILLGHPNPNPRTILQRAVLDSRRCRLKAVIFPIHHGIRALNEYALPLLERCDVAFGIMGDYWYASLDDSFLRPWKEKIIRLDMAIDATQYPWVKQSFNPPGRRGYLYIGSNLPEKGPEVLSATMAGLSQFRRGWIGDGSDIAGLPRISGVRSLTPRFMSAIAKNYDIFVNTSVSDANPTTILEAMSWGFPIACTPQSGYWRMPGIVELSTTDIQTNVERLMELQYVEESHLLGLSEINRQLVTSKYTWTRFCSSVWDTLRCYV
jgi:glycosyltransferase involved in cell wall biosynthesis